MTITQRIKTLLGGVGEPAQNWLFLGVGYTAKALISQLPTDVNISGTSRNPQDWPDSLKARVSGIKFNGHISDALKAALKTADIIIMSQPPSQAGDPFLNAVDTNLTALAPSVKWAAYLSATSVYGDRAGQWAFEGEGPTPAAARGAYRAKAELAWLETGLPVHIFRLAGIYGGTYFGQSRNPFGRIKSGKARAVIKPDHIVNRIHAEDIADALLRSMAAPSPLRIYNLADGHPAPPQEVLRFAARLCGAPPPPDIDMNSPELSDMARSFYGETKRISNDRAMGELDWNPAFPNYQQGLMSIYKGELNAQAAVILTGYIDVPPEKRRIIDDALPRHIRLSRAEPACRRFDVEADMNIAGRFHIVEIFENKAGFDAHKRRSAASDWTQASADIAHSFQSFGYKTKHNPAAL